MWLFGVVVIEIIFVVLYVLVFLVVVMLVYWVVRDLNVDVFKKLYVVILSGVGGSFNFIYIMFLIKLNVSKNMKYYIYGYIDKIYLDMNLLFCVF